MCDQQYTIGSRLYFYDYTTVWNEWKQVTFVLHWTAITVYKIREVAMHYLFTRSPVTGSGCQVDALVHLKFFLGKSPAFLGEHGRKTASRPMERVQEICSEQKAA